MRLRLASVSSAMIVGLGLATSFSAAAKAGDTYQVDGAHSWVAYRVKHLGVANSFGIFKAISGSFVVDEAAPEKSSMDITVKVDSIDSGNPARDQHLKSPDFFNAKQFPTITFKSRKVTKSQDGYEVTGDLTLHGVKKELVFKVDKIGTAKDPRGGQHAGFSVDVPIKRTDYGIKTATDMIADEVLLEIGIEGMRK